MKKTIVYCLLILPTIMACKTGLAQDPHFSQYFSSPSSVNPALTGKGVEDWRLIGTYRSQWWGGNIAPFTTTAVSLEKSVHGSGLAKSNWGFGLSLLSDASNSGLLKNNYVNGSIAYNLDLAGDGKQQLGIGITGSYSNRMLDASKFSFQSQFGSMGFQRSASSGDPVSILSSNNWDMNIGVHLSNDQGKWGYSLGAAAFHLSTPTQGVYNNSTYKLDRRYTFQASVFSRTKTGNELHFSGITDLQGSNSIFTLGALYKIKVLDETLSSINVGIWERFGDSFYPYAGIESKNWLFGVSYDVVNSNVHDTYSSVQSLEFSFAWKLGKHKGNRTPFMY